MDTTGIDTGLQVDNNQAAALYFVVTVAIGNFFWLNLLVTALGTTLIKWRHKTS